jgi:hypothetical protein
MYNMYTGSIPASASAILVHIQQASGLLQVYFKGTTKVGQCFTITDICIVHGDT